LSGFSWKTTLQAKGTRFFVGAFFFFFLS